jgi:mRNA interferase RelE/StbE
LDIQYRQLFLKDLKKLRKQPVYDQIYELAFTTLPDARSLQDLVNIKAMKGYSEQYRIRIGDYRVGIAVRENSIEVMRVLHRREFYRYFP